MTLQLVKIVEGMGEGTVLYHSISEFPLNTGRSTRGVNVVLKY